MNATTGNTKRNQWLLAALGIVVVFFIGDWGYTKFVEEPAATSARLKTQLTKKLKAAESELAKSTRIMDQLELIEKKSLPWDGEMARSRYQAWLLQLAQDARLEGTSVDAGEPVPVTATTRGSRRSLELYRRFNFSLRGRGDLGQITRFLYDFYRAGHLHKIRSMNLNPGGQSQQIDMSVSIEAIALPNADRETELTTLVSEELALSDVRDYQLIARRNFFSRGGAQSAWRQIVLTAITFDSRGVGEAWFKVAGQSQTAMLQVGDALSRSSFDVVIVELDDASATVNVDGQLLRLNVGQSLAEATPR